MVQRAIQAKNGNKASKILLIEDNEADIKITIRAFKEAKLKNSLYVVRNGEQALNFLQHKGEFADAAKFPRPDLILLDINLPKINGFQVLEFLKANLAYATIPVTVLTSSQNQDDIEKSYRGGAACFIQKPAEYEDFAKFTDQFNYYWQLVSLVGS